MTTRDEVAAAIMASRVAGWQLPTRYQPSTQPGYRDSFDVVEADGTRVAIVGQELDAKVIVTALNWVLTMPIFEEADDG